MKDLLRQAVAAHREAILDFTRALVALPTENPPGDSYRVCAELIAAKLRELGLDSEILEVPRENAGRRRRRDPAEDDLPRFCLRSFFGRGPRTLYFHGHYDVVPAASPAQFRPEVRGGNLFGRGSADMKGGLAAMVYAVKALQDCGIGLDGRIGLVFVPDEETGGARGSQYLLQKGWLGGDAIGMLTPEPTSGVIWNASRGAISLRVTARGKPAHVGLQHQGVNAFERMLAVAQALLPLKAEVEARQTRYPIYPEAARRSILMLGGRSEGGTNFNVVPAASSFTVDRRLNPEEDLATEKRRLLEVFDRLRREGIELDVEVFQEGHAAGVEESGPVAQALASSVEAVTGKRPAFEMCPGLLEIRFYARQGIPALAYGPGRLSMAHGPNEFVRLEDVYSCAAIYALTALALLGTGN